MLEKQVEVVFRDAYPGAALMTVGYRNVGKQPIAIAAGGRLAHASPPPSRRLDLLGVVASDRRDWVQRVTAISSSATTWA